jgi:2-polyprenyl-3-methyl-5-hydroxy-6-metoxy-1,4-benzoquinol methylase
MDESTELAVRQLYASDEAAARYDRLHRGRARHRREVRCIQRALAGLPAESSILDLPCGTGRMFEALADLGLRITGADRSPAMLATAREAALRQPRVVDLCEIDVFESGFEDDRFDAVLCNRLLHHFPSADDRRAALRELARICRGPLLVSFFCSAALDALRGRWRNARRGTSSGRLPIPWAAFRRDVEAAGLRAERVLRTLPGISKQWYVVLRP